MRPGIAIGVTAIVRPADDIGSWPKVSCEHDGTAVHAANARSYEPCNTGKVCAGRQHRPGAVGLWRQTVEEE